MPDQVFLLVSEAVQDQKQSKNLLLEAIGMVCAGLRQAIVHALMLREESVLSPLFQPWVMIIVYLNIDVPAQAIRRRTTDSEV